MTHALPDIVAELAGTLHDKGLPSGRPLVVHSGMGPLVNELRARGIKGRDLLERTCGCFADALAEVVGPEGTLCIPGFFYDYARKGLTFDARTSPPDEALGIFPGYFFSHRMQNRSLNPLVSLMTAGAQAEHFAAAPSRYGNGTASPWARLVEAGGWMLFFGCTPASMTFTHHVEHLAGVPHLYSKIYRVPVVDMDGNRHPGSVCAVRFLDARFPVTYALEAFGNELEQAGILVRGQWGRVPFSLAPLRATQDYLMQRLIADPFALLEHPPTFVRGVIPDDGPAAA